MSGEIEDKTLRCDFNFQIVNFPILSSNIPTASVNGVYVSQLIRLSRACGNYHNFLDRAGRLTQKFPDQGYVALRLWPSHQEVLWQTSWACWKLRDVCYPECNWSEVVDSFPFIGFAYYRTWPWITRQVYCNRHELLTLTKQRGSPPFHWRSVLFMSICVLSVFVGCCSVLCFQCVSFGLGCRSLIAPSIFFSHFGLMKLSTWNTKSMCKF